MQHVNYTPNIKNHYVLQIDLLPCLFICGPPVGPQQGQYLKVSSTWNPAGVLNKDTRQSVRHELSLNTAGCTTLGESFPPS